VQTTIPFKDQPTSEEAVTAVVDALAHALAAQLHAGPWEPAQIRCSSARRCGSA
jgi:hypothetical protein